METSAQEKMLQPKCIVRRGKKRRNAIGRQKNTTESTVPSVSMCKKLTLPVLIFFPETKLLSEVIIRDTINERQNYMLNVKKKILSYNNLMMLKNINCIL